MSKVDTKAAGIAEGKDGRRVLGRGLGRKVAFVKAEEVGLKAQRFVVKAEEEKWWGRRNNDALLLKLQEAFEKKTGQLARENGVVTQRLGIPCDVPSRRLVDLVRVVKRILDDAEHPRCRCLPVEGKRMTTIPEDAGED